MKCIRELYVFMVEYISRKLNYFRAIGMSTAFITKAVLNDTRSIVPVSTCVRGLYGVEEDVFLSVPCSISSEGVQRVAVLPLNPSEEETFRKCAKGIWEVQSPIWDSL